MKSISTLGGKTTRGKHEETVALVPKVVENDGGLKPLVLHFAENVVVSC